VRRPGLLLSFDVISNWSTSAASHIRDLTGAAAGCLDVVGRKLGLPQRLRPVSVPALLVEAYHQLRRARVRDVPEAGNHRRRACQCEGVRQPDREVGAKPWGISDAVWNRRVGEARGHLNNFALYNAPAGSTQHMPVYFYLSRNIDVAMQDVQNAVSAARRRLPLRMRVKPALVAEPLVRFYG